MSDLKVLVWKTSDATGEPDVEIKMPARLAKWVPRLMRYVPARTKKEAWGEGAELEAILSDIEQMLSEAAQTGSSEVVDVKTRDARVKVFVEEGRSS